MMIGEIWIGGLASYELVKLPMSQPAVAEVSCSLVRSDCALGPAQRQSLAVSGVSRAL